jgi:hypothetical protein
VEADETSYAGTGAKMNENGMKTRMIIKLTAVGALIVAVAYGLRGHDVLTGIALVLLFLVVVAKVISAILFHRRSEPPPGDGGGRRPPDAPVPRLPGGRPPELSAVAEMKS